MNTNHKLGSVRELALFGRLLRGSLIATAVFALAFVVAPYIITEANAQNVASVGVTWEAVSLTLDPDYGNGSIGDENHGNVLFGSITPTSRNTTLGSYGTQRVIKKTIGVETPGKYYSVYLSMSGSSNALTMAGTSMTINAIDAVWDGATDGDDDTNAPSAFSSSAWGFAVPTTQTGTYTTPFTGNYAAYDTVLGRDLTVGGTGSSVYNSTTWAAVPASGGAQQIWKATTDNNNGFGTRIVSGESVTGDTIKDHFNVYYAVMVDTDKMAGTYENNVVYTALASSVTLDSVSKNLSRSEEYVKQGTAEVLSFDLSASTALISQSQVKVYLVPHVLVAHNNYESINGFADNATECTNTSSFALTDHGATITCTMPASPNGIDDGVTEEGTITVGEDTLDVQKGEFDFWINIPDYGYNYISKYTRVSDPVASVVYAGLQSKDAGGTAYLTKMQEMTATVCENTNKWGNTTVYKPTGTEADDATAGTLDGTVTLNNPSGTTLTSASIKTDGTKDGIGTFELTDSRDNKTYLVRKLADNNCWMVQNLDLDLAAAQAGTISLTNTNTDIDYARTSGRTGWVPGATQQAEADAMGEGKTFADVAEVRLGTRQTSQFGNTSGSSNHWGSKYAYNVAYNDVTGNWEYSLGSKSLIDSNDLEVTGVTSKTTGGVTTWTCTWAPKNRGWLTSTSRNGTVTTQSGSNTTTSTISEADCRSKTPTAKGATWIENNSLAAMPRSYDTGSNWINNMGTSNTDGVGGNNRTSGTPNSPSEYVGDYYNWYAATAESGTWDMDSGKASDSICPYGWQLPENGGTKSWYNLITTTYSANSGRLGSRRLRSFPLSVIMSGYYNWVNGNLNNRGTYGSFWSSTPYAVTDSHGLNFYSTYVYPQGGNNKTYGLTVRCVAR